MNIFKNLTQGSDEWLKVRLSHFTASETAAMLNVSSYMSRTELLDLKKSGIAKPVNENTQKLFDKGHTVEEMARPIAEEIIGEDLYPVTASIDVDNVKLLASFDGLTLLNDIVWEHKLLNKKLKESLLQGNIPEQYKPQLQQQLMVSGADKALFMASDGTKENCFYVWYESDKALTDNIMAGWQQFAKDLATHEVKTKEEKIIATEADNFPMITFEVTGTEISSNAEHCLELIKGRIAIELTNTLESDQDFADAKELVKQVKKARENLKVLQQNVQDQFVSYRDFSVVAKEIDSVLQKFGASRDKEVKAAEQAKKTAIITQANTELDQLLFSLQTEFNGVAVIVNNDFTGVIKNKRTIESIQNAVDSELARCKIIANEQATKIRANIKTLNELAADYQYLFNDSATLVSTKNNDDLINLIKSRINEHEAAEKERLAEQAEQMRLDAERKANAKAEAKIKAEREAEQRKAQIIENDRLLKANEAQAKVEAEQAATEAHEEQLQAQRPEFCGREFPSQEPLQALPISSNPTNKVFTVKVEWSGYSRGYSVYEVEAINEEQAKECYYDGERVSHHVIRDDTESQEVNIINPSDKAA